MARGPWGSLSLVFAALSVCGALGGSCDRSLCSSVADDCCAPLSIGEAATCRNGYVAQRTGNGCFGYGEGDYTCCSTSASSEFSFVANVGSWSNGRAQCQSRGGDLATIHSAAEDAAAKAVVPSGSSAWFGLSDTTTEGSYAWVDGSALDYINWAGGEPNNWGGNEDCGGYYKGHTSGWADGGCDEWEGAEPVGAVCSIPGSSTGSDDDSFTFVAGSQACLFDFEDTAIDSCPSGWTCTGDARVVSRYTCVSGCGTPLPNAQGEQYFSIGGDGDTGTAQSPTFELPSDAQSLEFLRCGGADSPSGVSVHRESGSVVCSSSRGDDTDSFFWDSCDVSSAAGERVYVRIVDSQSSYWGKVFVDNIRLDGGGDGCDDSGGSSGSNCDRSLCSSVADDCCAPLSIGEAAT